MGKSGTLEADEADRRNLAEYLATGKVPAPQSAPPAALTLAEILFRDGEHVESYYVLPNGSPTSELSSIRAAVRPHRAPYGSLPADAVGPTS